MKKYIKTFQQAYYCLNHDKIIYFELADGTAELRMTKKGKFEFSMPVYDEMMTLSGFARFKEFYKYEMNKYKHYIEVKEWSKS